MSLIDSRPTTLLQRLTAARAAFLDADISSRAPASSALSTTQWTNARATKLDNLDKLLSTIGPVPPTTNGLKGVIISNADIYVTSTGSRTISPIITASTSTYNVWTTLLSVTAVGVIEIMTAYQVANTSDRDAQLRLKIDGNIVYISNADLWKVTGDDNDGISLIGTVSSSFGGLAWASISFSTSFLLEFKKTENAAGTVEIGTLARYYLT